MRTLIFIPLLSLSACSPKPEWYPLPLQREFAPGQEPRGIGSVISMDDPQAEANIVSGLLPGAPAKWRWAYQRAEFRLVLEDKKGMKFFADFAIADATFQQTGPVTMRFFIDGKLLATEHYDKPGEKHFETPVNENLLKVSEAITVAAEVDKVFTSPTDGAKLGFLLVRLGFMQ